MRFSIIIATYNRSGLLARAIRSIENQNYKDIEIIVSDDASNDNTRQVVEGFKDPRIVYLCNDAHRGLSATRNAALKIARGVFFVFMDDDVTLRGDFLEALDKITSENNIAVLSPRIIDPQTNEPFVNYFLNKERKELGYFDFNCFLGGTHIFAKEIIRRAGFYDERFGIGAEFHASEESDYFFRLKKLDEKIVYCPGLVAYHSLVKEQSADKVFNYSYGIAAMLTKNMFADRRHWYYYFLIIAHRISVSFLRAAQYTLLPNSIRAKNKKYKYKYFFLGTVKGIFGYLRST